MSFRVPNHKRVQIDCSQPVLTDQSAKKMCDINNIIMQYQKTGLLPHLSDQVGRYVDNTLAIPLEEAYERLSDAKHLFYQLPAQVRKLMDNDPAQLESYIQNPDNHSILVKYGVLELRTPPKKDEGVTTPSPSGSKPAAS